MDRAVLFDLDGTIWDSWPWFAALLEAADDGMALEDHLDRLRDGAAAARLLRDAGITSASIRSACATGMPPLFPWVGDTLTSLSSSGVRTGAVTNLPQWLYGPMLAAHEATLHLEVVVGWGDAPSKPRPDPLWMALEKLGLSRDGDHWYVGDTVGDRRSAHAAGMSFAWASWGYGDVCPDPVDQILRSFADARGLG